MKTWRLAGVFVVGLVAAAPAIAAEFYASPDGSPRGDGTRDAPWDLATALGQSARVRPGDTLWLRGGTYRSECRSLLEGTAEAPIVIRGAPGEWPVIDLAGLRPGNDQLVVDGAWTVFRDFEIACTDPKRVTDKAGPWPEDIVRGGVMCRGSHVAFRNLVVHDLSNGFGFWAEGEGGEITGCLISNCGWKGPDRGHGHAIYAQNVKGVKRIEDNILFQQFGQGLHIYGSKKASLRGFHVEGNVAFDNGLPGGGRSADLRIGGESPASEITVVNNFTWGNGASFGYPWGQQNRDLVVRGNVFGGGVQLLFWDQVELTGNTLIASEAAHLQFLGPADLSRYRWNRNHYWRPPGPYPPFAIREGDKSRGMTWDDWRKATGFDADSPFVESVPTEPLVFVRPNRHEPGRAHVVVYNLGKKESVSADLSRVLKPGDTYRVHRATDFFGKPVAAGTYDGRPLALQMSGGPTAAPVGLEGFKPPQNAPQFDVFVVRTSTDQ